MVCSSQRGSSPECEEACSGVGPFLSDVFKCFALSWLVLCITSRRSKRRPEQTWKRTRNALLFPYV